MVYDGYTLYGPYKRKDGREHVILKKQNKRKTVSYPKYLMEVYLDRYLEKNETVDHIDRDITNNSIDNLRVIRRSEHVTLDVKRYKEQKFTCPWCGAVFDLQSKRLHDAIYNRKQKKSGPFCSRSCAGRYGKSVQLGGPLLKLKELEPEYTTLKDEENLEK